MADIHGSAIQMDDGGWGDRCDRETAAARPMSGRWPGAHAGLAVTGLVDSRSMIENGI